jgi:hypothetical protein
MIGRGSAGAIPLVLTAIASRRDDLAAGGVVAALIALAVLAAELADFQAQRDIGRRLDDSRDGASLAYRLCVIALILPFAGAAAAAVTRDATIIATFLSTAIWPVMINVYGGRALRNGDFRSLAVGPFIGMIGASALALFLPRVFGLAGYAVAFHIGRAIELAVMMIRTGRISLRRFQWAKEWTATRELLLGSFAATVVGRGLTPAAFVIAGSVAAGVFGIGMQLLAAIALLPFSFATTGFHAARGAPTATEALERMRASYRLAVQALLLVIPAVTAVALWGARRFLDYREPWMLWTLALLIVATITEPMATFHTAALHVAFRDRAILIANTLGAATLAVLVPLCAWLLGPVGLAVGVAVTRICVVPVIWIRSTRD